MNLVIYGLRDPKTNEIRYVGQSRKGLRRAKTHKQLAKRGEASPKADWIRSLLNEGLEYEIVALEYCSDERALHESERKWIVLGRKALGQRLTNQTTGGQGHPGHLHSDETRKKLSLAWTEARRKTHADRMRNRKVSDETRRLSSIAHRNPSQELRDRIATALRGRCLSREHKEKISAGGKGIPKSAETRARMRTSWKLRREKKKWAEAIGDWT